MTKLDAMNCEKLVQNDKNSDVKQSNRSSICKLPIERNKKQNLNIVFNNQTDRLIKRQFVDQSTPVMGKYNLRKKSVTPTKSDCIKKSHQQTTDRHLRGLKDDDKPKKRSLQLSRYKRKNANARERFRVQVIRD